MLSTNYYFMALEDKAEYFDTDEGVIKTEVGAWIIALLETNWEAKCQTLSNIYQEYRGENELGKAYKRWYQNILREIAPTHPLLKVFVQKQILNDIRNLIAEDMDGEALGKMVDTPEWQYIECLNSDDNVEISPAFVERVIWICMDRLKALERVSSIMKGFVMSVLDAEGHHCELSVLQRYALFRASNEMYERVAPQEYQRLGTETHVTVSGDTISRSKTCGLNRLEQLTEDVKKLKRTKPVVHTYRSTDCLSALAYLEFDYMAEKEVILRRCMYCGRYFRPTTIAARYCDRPISHEPLKTCKSVGAKSAFQKRVDANEAKKLYIKVNNRIQTWVGRQDNGLLRVKYNKWKNMAVELLEEVGDGKITFETYKEILDKRPREALGSITLNDGEMKVYQNTVKRLSKIKEQ